MELGKDKSRRVEVRCSYCHKFLSEYFYQYAADTYADAGGYISHGICLSCLIEHYPNEYPAIKKALSKRPIGSN